MLINKPAGLFSQAAAGIESVQSLLVEQIKVREAHVGRPFVGLPHRLDRGTSGVMLIARNQRALARFGQQFQSRKIGKYYLAILEGELAGGIHVWEDHVRKIADQPRAEIVEAGDPGGRVASMELCALARVDRQVLTLIRLDTGRMHQIRLQATSRGLPVVGDPVYGCDAAIAIESAREKETAGNTLPIALHALRLELRHPQTGVLLAGTAPVPAFWQAFFGEFIAPIDAVFARSSAAKRSAWSLSQLGSE